MTLLTFESSPNHLSVKTELSINFDKNTRTLSSNCKKKKKKKSETLIDWFDWPNVSLYNVSIYIYIYILWNARQVEQRNSRKKHREQFRSTREREREREDRMCVCVCVCVWERERERERRQVTMIVTHQWGHRSITMNSVVPIKSRPSRCFEDWPGPTELLSRGSREYQRALQRISFPTWIISSARRTRFLLAVAISREDESRCVGGYDVIRRKPEDFAIRDSRGIKWTLLRGNALSVALFATESWGNTWFGRIVPARKKREEGFVEKRLADDSESSRFRY